MEPRDAYRKINLLRFLTLRDQVKNDPVPRETPKVVYDLNSPRDRRAMYMHTTQIYYRIR
jgi:hypothetical protein